MALLKRSLQSLREQATIRPADYMEDVLARADRVDDEHYWIDPQAYLDLCRRWQTAPPPKPRPSRPRRIANLIGSADRVTRSVTRTSLGIDRATDKQVEVRLNVCRQCPGNHATWKNGDVHTCGPMLQSMAGNGGGTCGCILRRKARDLTEQCPLGWWPSRRLAPRPVRGKIPPTTSPPEAPGLASRSAGRFWCALTASCQCRRRIGLTPTANNCGMNILRKAEGGGSVPSPTRNRNLWPSIRLIL